MLCWSVLFLQLRFRFSGKNKEYKPSNQISTWQDIEVNYFHLIALPYDNISSLGKPRPIVAHREGVRGEKGALTHVRTYTHRHRVMGLSAWIKVGYLLSNHTILHSVKLGTADVYSFYSMYHFQLI